MPKLADSTVATIASASPAAARVFQRHGIDFCCGGGRALAQVCAERDLDPQVLLAEIEAAEVASPGPSVDWRERPLAELARHIVVRYHGWLRTELPVLGRMADRVEEAHGASHPGLVPPVVALFRQLDAELVPHLDREERVLFPFLERLEAVRAGQLTSLPPLPPLPQVLAAMEEDHREVGEALARLRRLTGGYVAPADACTTWRAFFLGLADLEREIHEHVHLENHVLFPRALRLAEALPAR